MSQNRYKVTRNVLKVLSNVLADEIDDNFEECCKELLASDAQNLVIDFGNVGYASSICVVMAAKIFFETRRSNRKLRIRAKKSVLKIFKMCGFDYDERISLEQTD